MMLLALVICRCETHQGKQQLETTTVCDLWGPAGLSQPAALDVAATRRTTRLHSARLGMGLSGTLARR